MSRTSRLSLDLCLSLLTLLILTHLGARADQTTCVCMNGGVEATFKAQCNPGYILVIRATYVAQRRGSGGQSCGSAGYNEVTYDGNDCPIQENVQARWRALDYCNTRSSDGCNFRWNYNDGDFQSCTSWAQGYRYSCLRYDCIAKSSNGVDDTVVYMSAGSTRSYTTGSKIQLRTPSYPSLSRDTTYQCSFTLPPNTYGLMRIYDYRGHYITSTSNSSPLCPYRLYMNAPSSYRDWCSADIVDYAEQWMPVVSYQQRIDVVFSTDRSATDPSVEGALWIVVETNSASNLVECGSDITQNPVPGRSTTSSSTTTIPTTTTRTTTTTPSTTTTRTTTTTPPTTTSTRTTTTTPPTTTSTTTTPTTTTSTSRTSTSTATTTTTTPTTSRSSPLLPTTTIPPLPSSSLSTQPNPSSISSGGDTSVTRDPRDNSTTYPGGTPVNKSAVIPVAVGVGVGVGGLILIALALALIYCCVCSTRRRDAETKRPPTPPRTVYTTPSSSGGWDDVKIAEAEANNNTRITRANAKDVKAKAVASIMNYDSEAPKSQHEAYHQQPSYDGYGRDGGDIYDTIDDVESVQGSLRNKGVLVMPQMSPKIPTIAEENSGTMPSVTDNTYRKAVRFQDKPELISSPPGYIQEEEESNIGTQFPNSVSLKDSNLSSYSPRIASWEPPEISGPKWTGPSYEPKPAARIIGNDDGGKFNTGFSNYSDDEKTQRLHKAVGSGNTGPRIPLRENPVGVPLQVDTTGSNKKGFTFGFGKSSTSPVSPNKLSGNSQGFARSGSIGNTNVPAGSTFNGSTTVGAIGDEQNDVMQNPLYGHASMIF